MSYILNSKLSLCLLLVATLPTFPVIARATALLLPEWRCTGAGRLVPPGGAGVQDPLQTPGPGARPAGHNPTPGRLQQFDWQLRETHTTQRR